MLFKQLLYFTTVAETLNISLAAKKLYISQPPISRQIMLLEKDLGVQLFIRKNKGLELTEPGLMLYRHVKDLFTNIDAIMTNVKEEAHSFRGTIKLGSIPSGMPFLIEKLKFFKNKYPDVNINLRTDTPNMLLDELERGNLNAIFVRNFIHHNANFAELEVAVDSLALLIHRRLDPQPERSFLKYQEISTIPMCTLRPNDTWKYSELFLDECRKRNIHPHVLYECNDTPSIMQLVQNAMAAAFLPIPLLNTIQMQGDVYAKPLEGLNLSSPLTMVYSNSAYVPACVKAFFHVIKSDLSTPTLSDQNFE